MTCAFRARRAAVLAVLTAILPARADPIDVFVLAGQSNMIGQRGYGAPDLPPELVSQSDVLLYDDVGPRPLGPEFGPASQWFRYGPELTFGRIVADARPHRRIALVKFTIGAAPITVWQPGNPPPNDGYAQLRARHQAALDDLSRRDLQPRMAGFVWMQGESDSFIQAEALAYEQDLRTLIAAIRADLGTPATPVVIGRINPLESAEFDQFVRQAQQDVAAEDPYIALVNTDDLSESNDAHFDLAGLGALGNRFGEAYLAIPEPAGLALLLPAALAVLKPIRRSM